MNIRAGVLTIDPTNMSPDESMLVAYFFRYNIFHIELELCEKDKTFRYPGIYSSNATGPFSKITSSPYNDINSIKFTHTLVRRERHSSTGYRYDVYGDMIGQGGCGSVFDSIGTLVPTHDGLMTLEKNVHRVGKQVQYPASVIEAKGKEAIPEYVIGQNIPGLHMHKPVFFPMPRPQNNIEKFYATVGEVTQTGMIVMRYVPGENLPDALKANNSVDERLKIAIAAMRSLQRLHEKNIVHRDIKPDNMKVERVGNKVTVHWFDFNGSRLAGVNDGINVYTPFYESPEVHFRQPQTQESDVFSVACMIARDIFDADENPAKLFREKIVPRLRDKSISASRYFKLVDQAVQKQKKAAVKCKFTHMFNGKVFNELSQEHKKYINQKLSEMVSKNPSNRPSLDDAIMLFEEIRWERLLKKNSSPRSELLRAKTLAEQLPKQIQFDPEKADRLIDCPHAALRQILQSFRSLEDNPELIAVFSEYLNMDLFTHAKTQTEFNNVTNAISAELNKCNALVERFPSIKTTINELRDKIKSLPEHFPHAEFTQILYWTEQKIIAVDRKLDRMRGLNPIEALDEITSINKKLERHRDNIIKGITFLESKMTTATLAEKEKQAASQSSTWHLATSAASLFSSLFSSGSSQASAAMTDSNTYRK